MVVPNMVVNHLKHGGEKYVVNTFTLKKPFLNSDSWVTFVLDIIWTKDITNNGVTRK